MKLNKQNYYSQATSWDYWSTSQFKDFENCEAAALAKLRDEWQPTSNPEALLVGNYLHSYYESPEAHRDFIEENHDQIIAKAGKYKGQPKAAYKQADMMIKTLDDDDFFKMVYQGEKEVPVSGTLGGVDWKGKLDCLNLDKGYFCDLKTVDDIHKRHWNDYYKQWQSFVEDRGYVLQMAVYRELIKQVYGVTCEPFIFAVSKQTPPDKLAINIDPMRYQDELDRIDRQIEHFEAVKTGQEKPVACGTCEYCRSHKQLEGFVEVGDLID